MPRFLSLAIRLPLRLLKGLRETLANLLMLGLLVLLAATVLDKEPHATLPESAWLEVALGDTLVEQRSLSDPLAALLPAGEMPQESVLQELVTAIQRAGNDPRIRGMTLHTDRLQGSDLAKLDTLARAIEGFRRNGKPVFAVGDTYSQAQYYLASTADTVYLNPMGSVQLVGFAVYQSYLKDLLDRLSVNIHIFRAGQFKSFVEPFVRNDMSPEARENLETWLGQQWAYFTGRVETRRKLAPGSLDRYTNQQDLLLAAEQDNPAQLAQHFGLVDELATRDAADAAIQAHQDELGAEPVDAETYFQMTESHRDAAQLLEPVAHIAVIHAVGPIMDGEQPPGYAGAENLIEQIQRARDDEQVAAVVLRIDSPGGSAMASELIRNALETLQADGKPLVASMGGVAASGGYWIAANAREIWAAPTTITGSIGVFGVVPTLEHSLGQLGIHSDGASTTALGDALQLDRPMSPLAERVLQQGVDFTYQAFLARVAAGRGSTPAEIDRVAQGRVWTGADAHRLHLVDHLGDLEDAIGAAARLASLSRYEVDYLEPALTPFERLLQDIAAPHSHVPAPLGRLLGSVLAIPAWQSLLQLQVLNDPQHLYARCWECGMRIR